MSRSRRLHVRRLASRPRWRTRPCRVARPRPLANLPGTTLRSVGVSILPLRIAAKRCLLCLWTPAWLKVAALLSSTLPSVPLMQTPGAINPSVILRDITGPACRFHCIQDPQGPRLTCATNLLLLTVRKPVPRTRTARPRQEAHRATHPRLIRPHMAIIGAAIIPTRIPILDPATRITDSLSQAMHRSLQATRRHLRQAMHSSILQATHRRPLQPIHHSTLQAIRRSPRPATRRSCSILAMTTDITRSRNRATIISISSSPP